VAAFFEKLDLSGFSSLSEFALPYYVWPRAEYVLAQASPVPVKVHRLTCIVCCSREILKARMPTWALQIQEKFGVVVTGAQGKSWKQRYNDVDEFRACEMRV